jgi:hypothetical protein
MQTVSGSWAATISAAVRSVLYGVQISWPRTVVTSGFFTIGTSTIGGPDIIKSGGSAVAFFDKYQYSDYSDYVMSWDVERKLGQYPYGVVMSQADLRLDNSSKLFTPDFDGSIGTHVDKPNRPIKISLGFDSESLQQFVGFTGMPEANRQDRRVDLHAFDVFSFINSYESSLDVQIDQYSDEIIEAGLLEMGFSASQFVLDQSLQQKIGFLAPKGQNWGDIFQKLCEAEQGLMFADENGIIRFWNRQHFLTNSSTVQTLTFSNMENLETQNTPIFNDVIVRARPRTLRDNQPVWDARSSIVLEPGSNTVSVDFTDDFGALPVGTLDTPLPVSSATTSAYVANLASSGDSTDMTASVSVTSVTSFGTSAEIVFNNTAPSSVYLTGLQLWGTPAKVSQVIEQRHQDQTSIDDYGLCPGNNYQPLEIENDYIQDSSTANSLAYTLVKEFKDPHRRYEAPIFANPALQIGDFLEVTDADTATTKNMYLTGYKTHLGQFADLRQVVYLEERSIQSYFTIGTSTIGGTDMICSIMRIK